MDRERGFVKCASREPIADLYLCWSPKAVYVGLYALDVTEDAFYQDHFVPECDRSLWVLRTADMEPLQMRLGAGRKPVLSDKSVHMRHISGVNLNVRSVTAVALTAARMGRKSFRAGDVIQLDSCFWTQGGCYRMDWNGTFVLAD